MDFSFENVGTNTYLVYQLKDSDAIDSMSLGMLTNNSISGFAAASFMQMDMEKYIKYNVSAKVSVKQLFSGPVNKKRLLGVFTGVIDAMLSAEDYMLDPASILLDPDYIFADVTTCETELVCLPVMNLNHTNQDLTLFFKNILFTTQFDQTENCDHVAQLINYLNTNPMLVLADFKELLRTISGAQPHAKVEPAPQPVAQPAPAPVQQVVQPVAAPAPAPVPPAQRPAPVVTPAPAPNTPEQKPVRNSIPTPPPAVPQPEKKAVPEAADEKPMSWLYLMQHYNAENAAIYKAQQEAKKNKTSAAAPAKPQHNSGFAIPGQPAAGFAIPGQPTPPPAAPAAQKPAVNPQPVAPKPAAANACPKCGKALTPGQAFCTSCGTHCGGAPVPAPTPVAAPTPAPQPVYHPQPSGTALNFGETTVLSASVGETTVLSAVVETKKQDPHLIRSKNNEKIPLNKPVFRIGKERSYVDYFISDNTAISRGHANIVDHNGEFFVVDTNSTNHTYLNGAMIQSGQEMKLCHGDKIRLANEDFEFKLY